MQQCQAACACILVSVAIVTKVSAEYILNRYAAVNASCLFICARVGSQPRTILTHRHGPMSQVMITAGPVQPSHQA